MSGTQAARPSLFTIGHSDHDIDRFLDLLREYHVDAVADVRSQPYSRHQPQFNRESLAEAVKTIDAKYVFLGRELGARRLEPESYDGNRARYDLIRHLPAFQEGLARIQRGVESNRIALLCAEKDPVTCHRTILVCRELRALPIDILTFVRMDCARQLRRSRHGYCAYGDYRVPTSSASDRRWLNLPTISRRNALPTLPPKRHLKVKGLALERSAVYHWLRRDIRRQVFWTSAKCERQTPN